MAGWLDLWNYNRRGQPEFNSRPSGWLARLIPGIPEFNPSIALVNRKLVSCPASWDF